MWTGLGGCSIVNVSWDCCLRAIFKPLSWHEADTQSLRTCTHAECDVDRRSWHHRHAVFRLIIGQFRWLPLLFYRLCLSNACSYHFCTLVHFIQMFVTLFLFPFCFYSPLFPIHMHMLDVFDFGVAATTFPSTHACSRFTETYTCCTQTHGQAREQFSLLLGLGSNNQLLSSFESFISLKVKVEIS